MKPATRERTLCVNCAGAVRGTGTGQGRCAACYRHLQRRGVDSAPRRERKVLTVLAAYACGETSEGQAAALLGIDCLALRERLIEAVDVSRRLWLDHRAAHPATHEGPSPAVFDHQPQLTQGGKA